MLNLEKQKKMFVSQRACLSEDSGFYPQYQEGKEGRKIK